MLQCRYCDYLKVVEKNEDLKDILWYVCDYTRYVFANEVEELDMEYPCNKCI